MDYYAYIKEGQEVAPTALADDRSPRKGVETSELGPSTKAADPECPLGSSVKPEESSESSKQRSEPDQRTSLSDNSSGPA
jgi:hypothetical protein